MKESDNRLIEWAVNEVETRYKDEVSILVEHNTSAPSVRTLPALEGRCKIALENQ
jgi:hypothetical protein